MPTIIILIAIIISLLLWQFFFEGKTNIELPESFNITHHKIYPISKSELFNKISQNERGRPIFLYFYADWCKICQKQFPIINEIARIFQNTDLTFIAVSANLNSDPENLASYLDNHHNIYFKPYYLTDPQELQTFMQEVFLVKYEGLMPFMTLFNKFGESGNLMTGFKNKSKIKKELMKLIQI